MLERHIHNTHIKGVAQKSTEVHMFMSDFTCKYEWLSTRAKMW